MLKEIKINKWDTWRYYNIDNIIYELKNNDTTITNENYKELNKLNELKKIASIKNNNTIEFHVNVRYAVHSDRVNGVLESGLYDYIIKDGENGEKYEIIKVAPVQEVNVGVFNVLAAGISACSDRYKNPNLNANKLFIDLVKALSESIEFKSIPTGQDILTMCKTAGESPQIDIEKLKIFIEKLKEVIDKHIKISDTDFKKAFQKVFSKFNDNLKEDKKGKTKEDENTYGKMMKVYMSELNFGMFSGFEIGMPSKKENDISNPEFQKNFFSAKYNFMRTQINNFFKSGNGDILVCPEYDYSDDISSSVKLSTNIKCIKVGNYIQPEPTTFKTENITPEPIGKVNTDSNFFRRIFFNSEKIDLKLIDNEFEEQLKKLEKKRINVLSVFDKQKKKIAILIAVHLPSSTSFKDYEKTKKDLDIINNIQVILEKKYKGLPIIMAGDFNFPLDTSEAVINGFDTKGESSFNEEKWTKFKTKYNLNSDGNVGVCSKSRFTKQMGNDQLWEGKGDRRSYNTDFIGAYYNNDIVISDKLKDFTATGEQRDTTKLHPYVEYKEEEEEFGFDNQDNAYEIDINKSWLSDHAFVMRTIPLIEPVTGSDGGKNTFGFGAEGGGRTLRRNLMRKSKRNKKRKRTKNKKRNNKGRNSRKRT